MNKDQESLSLRLVGLKKMLGLRELAYTFKTILGCLKMDVKQKIL